MGSAAYRAILFFGYPGCGKGTQGAALAGMPHLVHLAMGDIFRGLDKESEIGKEFLSYATKGMLVPDELTVRLWNKFVGDKVAAGAIDPKYHILLLDGIPRTPSQVELIGGYVDVLKIVHLNMKNQKKLVERLKLRASKSGRPDDAKEEVILNRIKVYEESTRPVLECYPPDLIAHINADQSPLAVLRDICDAIDSVVTTSI
ncbi:MAG TPA: nucleoside monophosphate kinase [Phycisphaerae bacterium]|nr:nucleoside monophosphate kinase [Phycisphaerales bacterium]HNO78902.1 nucleoside monophosphate kinase [Phycisphaerae bacterium]